jgi:SAM-dependent MidA family methyltransferase
MGTAGTSDERSPAPLLKRISAEAGPDGFVRFDRFMEIALYAEPGGYYTSPRPPVGTAGDFYTAPHVSPLFAATFGSRLREVRARMGPGEAFRLAELGPGDGTLMEGLLASIPPGSPELEGLEVVLVERSSSLRVRSLERVRPTAGTLGVEVRTGETLGSMGPFEGMVLANELLDAQPVRRLRRHGDGWVELGVRDRHGRLEPAEAPLTEPVPGSPLPSGAAEGTIVEVSPAAESLIREVADHLTRGVLVVDDFGMEEGELLAGHPHGTLDGVRAHRAGWDPLESPGSVDLSTFVNFTRLRAAASVSGLTLLSDRTQAEALGAWGFQGLLGGALAAAPNPEAEVRLRLAVKNLLFGFERFRILEFAPASEPVHAAPSR